MNEPNTLSMPDPCPHLTRIEVIRAKLHGDFAPLDHLEVCEDAR